MIFAITEFRGPYRWLSNFHPCPIILDGAAYPSVENAYQAAKTLDMPHREPFRFMSAGEAKRAGRLLRCRDNWESVKLSIMEDLLRRKFNQQPFRSNLMETGTGHIEEGNYWGDTFWGVCKGIGENHLGKLIMKIRSEICV